MHTGEFCVPIQCSSFGKVIKNNETGTTSWRMVPSDSPSPESNSLSCSRLGLYTAGSYSPCRLGDTTALELRGRRSPPAAAARSTETPPCGGARRPSGAEREETHSNDTRWSSGCLRVHWGMTTGYEKL